MKITPRDLLHNIEIQSDVIICWVPSDGYLRRGLEQEEKLLDLEVLFMYVEGDHIFLEVDEPDEELIKGEKVVICR